MINIQKVSTTIAKQPAKRVRKLMIIAFRVQKGLDNPLELYRMGVLTAGDLFHLQGMLECEFATIPKKSVMPLSLPVVDHT